MKENYGALPCPLCGNAATLRKHESRKHEGEGRAGRQGGMVGSFYIYCPPIDGRAQCGKVPVRSEKILAYLDQHGVRPPELTPNTTTTGSAPPVTKAQPTSQPPTAKPVPPSEARRGLWARRRAARA